MFFPLVRSSLSSFLLFLLSFSRSHFQVKVASITSPPFPQHEGVPHGSVLSTTLFLLAINNYSITRFATAAVVILVLLAMGWRESIIVSGAIIVTLLITLFASWVWGFTLNRVSLFALIFSIGILVDDAIVVVENIHRHRQQSGGAPLKEIIPVAVDEVGGPTILATLTVIAALLPMAFVTGLMGPYMSPIPINASMGMILSLMVAFIITPWLALHLSRKDNVPHAQEQGENQSKENQAQK